MHGILFCHARIRHVRKSQSFMVFTVFCLSQGTAPAYVMAIESNMGKEYLQATFAYLNSSNLSTGDYRTALTAPLGMSSDCLTW